MCLFVWVRSGRAFFFFFFFILGALLQFGVACFNILSVCFQLFFCLCRCISFGQCFVFL
jgi:hypothetical protein